MERKIMSYYNGVPITVVSAANGPAVLAENASRRRAEEDARCEVRGQCDATAASRLREPVR
jgi:head-tail adaptor